MKAAILGPLGALSLAAAALTGCASSFGSAKPVDPAKYAAMSCPDLNSALGGTSKGISATAISRGKVSQWSVPFWVPGGTKAVSAIQERQTGKIERLQGEERAIYSARQSRC
jgi:hypothetical protein